MCGIARTLLRHDACALVPKLCRDHKQQLSVGDGGEGGTTRFIHYFSFFSFICKSSLERTVAVTDSRSVISTCLVITRTQTQTAMNQNIWAPNGW